MKILFLICYKIGKKINSFLLKIYSYYLAFMFESCGKDLTVYGMPYIQGHGKITIGDRCRINKGVLLGGRGKIVVGDDVTFSSFATILTSGYDLLEKKRAITSKKHFDKKVIIGNGCWVGSGAKIMPGVSITGEGVVIAAGAIVTKDISENFVIVAGIPGKIIKRY